MRIGERDTKPIYIRILDYILKYHAWVPRHADKWGPIWYMVWKCVECTSSWLVLNKKLADVTCWIVQEDQGGHD